MCFTSSFCSSASFWYVKSFISAWSICITGFDSSVVWHQDTLIPVQKSTPALILLVFISLIRMVFPWCCKVHRHPVYFYVVQSFSCRTDQDIHLDFIQRHTFVLISHFPVAQIRRSGHPSRFHPEAYFCVDQSFSCSTDQDIFGSVWCHATLNPTQNTTLMWLLLVCLPQVGAVPCVMTSWCACISAPLH